jgi:hypothetical protein
LHQEAPLGGTSVGRMTRRGPRAARQMQQPHAYVPSARGRTGAGRRLRWQASTPLPPASSPRQLARSPSPIGTRADNQFGSSRPFGGAPGQGRASIDRGYASSTAFASSGGNGRPPLLLLLVPGRLAGSAVARVPGRRRHLTWRVRIG